MSTIADRYAAEVLIGGRDYHVDVSRTSKDWSWIAQDMSRKKTVKGNAESLEAAQRQAEWSVRRVMPGNYPILWKLVVPPIA